MDLNKAQTSNILREIGSAIIHRFLNKIINKVRKVGLQTDFNVTQKVLNLNEKVRDVWNLYLLSCEINRKNSRNLLGPPTNPKKASNMFQTNPKI